MAVQRERKTSNIDPLLSLALGVGTGLLVHKGFDAIGWQGNIFGDIGNIGVSSLLGFTTFGGTWISLSPVERISKSEMSREQKRLLRNQTNFGLLYGVGSAVLMYIGMSTIHATPDSLNAVVAGGVGLIEAYGFRKSGWYSAAKVRE